MATKKSKRVRKGGIFGNFPVDENPTEQEYSFAEKLNGRRHIRSGAFRSDNAYATGSGYCGDVSSEDFEIECKQTKNKSISIKAEWLNRMAIGAFSHSKKPALHLQFKDHLNGICDNKWVLIEERSFLELLRHGKDKEGDDWE